MNSCTFTGRLVADAEMRVSKSGASICAFRIASDVGFGDQKKTHWISCALFSDRGAKIQPYLRKGDPITVVGELSPPRTFEANGETRIAQDMIARDIALQGAKGDSGHAAPSTPSQAPRTAPAAPYGGGTAPASYDDEIPF